MKELFTATCRRCKSSFDSTKSTKLYCSVKCQGADRVKEWRKANRKQCPNCGVSITHEGIHCRACAKSVLQTKYKNCTLEEYALSPLLKGKHPSWKYVEIRGFARSWHPELSQIPCLNCGYSKHIELAHIIAIPMFPLTATLGEINDPSNIASLCRNCHWEFDHEMLTLTIIDGKRVWREAAPK